MSGSSLYIRYVLVMLMLIPGTICCFLPVLDHLAVGPGKAAAGVAAALAVFIPGGAALACKGHITSNRVGALILVVFLVIFRIMCCLSLTKTLYVFFNATMLTAWPTILTSYIYAAEEAANYEKVFSVKASLSCLLVSAAGIALFRKYLCRRLPLLLENPRLEPVWKQIFLIPLAFTTFFFWAIPKNPASILIGRSQIIGILYLAALLGSLYALCELFWLIGGRIDEEERRKREIEILRLEEDRYYQMQDYVKETRRMRHDYRQHLRVMSELASEDKTEELKRYLAEYEGNIVAAHEIYSTNLAVDAIAAYYAHVASEQDTTIRWKLSLPGKLPVSDTAYCMILGNLLENALHAVSTLPPEERRINVCGSVIGHSMLGLQVSNPYEGTVILDQDGLPLTEGREALGLHSVETEVTNQGGTLAIDTSDQMFRVNVLFNL